jgi:outer membrane PBP1 activator LpoA protein
VLNDYLKAVDILTIDYDKNTLKKQVAELTEKGKQDAYIIKGKLAEKEKEMEETKREFAELKAKQEEASRKQQVDIDQIKAQLEKNAEDQVGILLRVLSELQKQEPQGQKDFVLKKLGILTDGKIGQNPETGIVVEPLDQEASSSHRCFFCEQREKEEGENKDNQHPSTTEDAPKRLTKLSCSL